MSNNFIPKEGLTPVTPDEALHEFFVAFQPPNDPGVWANLIDEEAKEVVEAFAHLLKEIADLMYVVTGFYKAGGDESKFLTDSAFLPLVNDILDIASDHINNDLLRLVFHFVHVSNMSKLGDDGKPVRRDDGKIMKGPNYKAPDILGLLLEIGEARKGVQ